MENIIEQKSFRFAVRIVKMCRHLRSEKRELILTKQLLRSGTSIGANVTEAQRAQSKADFVSKLSIALKEASETKYWIRLLHASDYLTDTEYQSIFGDCVELEKILVSILNSSKQ